MIQFIHSTKIVLALIIQSQTHILCKHYEGRGRWDSNKGSGGGRAGGGGERISGETCSQQRTLRWANEIFEKAYDFFSLDIQN